MAGAHALEGRRGEVSVAEAEPAFFHGEEYVQVFVWDEATDDVDKKNDNDDDKIHYKPTRQRTVR